MSLRRSRSSRKAASAKRNQGSIGRTAQTIRSRVQPSRRRRAELAARQRMKRAAEHRRHKQSIKDALDKGPQIPHMGPKFKSPSPKPKRKTSSYDPNKRPKATVIKAKPVNSTNDPFGRMRKSKLSSEKRINARNRLSTKQKLERATGTTSAPKGVKNIGLKSAVRKATSRPKPTRKTRTPRTPIRNMAVTGPKRRTSGFGSFGRFGRRR